MSAVKIMAIVLIVAGLDLAKECLSLRPDIPIILCTGYGESITLERAKAMGIRQIILKSIIPAQLVEAIHLALEATQGRG